MTSQSFKGIPTLPCPPPGDYEPPPGTRGYIRQIIDGVEMVVVVRLVSIRGKGHATDEVILERVSDGKTMRVRRTSLHLELVKA